MPPSKSRRGMTRRTSTRSIPRQVVTMTQVEAFEARLSRGGDSCVVRSKVLGTLAATTTPGAFLNFSPNLGGAPYAFGSRQASIAQNFADYRIKSVIVKFLSSVTCALGILDDSSNAEGDAPATTSDVLELRCSASCLAGQTTPSVFQYTPAGELRWFKTYTGSSGSDQRFVNSGVLFAGLASGPGTISYELDVTVVYKGAVDNSSFNLVQSSHPSPSGALTTSAQGYVPSRLASRNA